MIEDSWKDDLESVIVWFKGNIITWTNDIKTVSPFSCERGNIIWCNWI